MIKLDKAQTDMNNMIPESLHKLAQMIDPHWKNHSWATSEVLTSKSMHKLKRAKFREALTKFKVRKKQTLYIVKSNRQNTFLLSQLL